MEENVKAGVALLKERINQLDLEAAARDLPSMPCYKHIPTYVLAHTLDSAVVVSPLFGDSATRDAVEARVTQAIEDLTRRASPGERKDVGDALNGRQ